MHFFFPQLYEKRKLENIETCAQRQHDCVNIIPLENQIKKSPLAFFRQPFGTGLPDPDVNSPLWLSGFHSDLSSDTVQAKTFSCVIPVAWSNSQTSLWISSVLHLFCLMQKLLVFTLSSLTFLIPFPTCKGTFLPCQMCWDAWLTQGEHLWSRQFATLL